MEEPGNRTNTLRLPTCSASQTRVGVLFPRLCIVFVEAARVRSQVVQGVCEAMTLKVVYQVLRVCSVRNEWEYSYALQRREMMRAEYEYRE